MNGETNDYSFTVQTFKLFSFFAFSLFFIPDVVGESEVVAKLKKIY